MKVLFTSINSDFVKREMYLLVNAIPSIVSVALEYKEVEDPRTLVILLDCPCCCFDCTALKTEGAVFVSAFMGISTNGYNISIVKKWPPLGRSFKLKDESECISEYLTELKTTIDNALRGD